LTGVLDVDHLRSALDSIQSRHEVLRTTYPSHDGIPYQAVSTGESVDFELIDISGDDADNHDDAVEQVIQREARKPFDLAKGPVWRVTLVALSPERHILIIVFHHIASDGWSMPIFYRELASHYHAGGRADLAPVPIQYSAYANRQRLRLGDGEFESDLRYWEKQLMGVPPLLELPSDRSRPPSPSAKGARYRFSLPGVTPSQVESLVRTTRVTPFMVGLSLFVGFLHRLSGAQDLVVGIPSADRPSTDVEDLIGFFVNSLAIRTVVDPKMSFRQLLEQVRETSIAAYNHRQVPFEHVVNRVNPVRNADRSPIFQVFFQSANNFDGRLELDDILVEPIPLVRTVTKFDLTLYLGLVQDEPSGNLVFATDLFDQETIVQLMDAFAIFVAGALGEPDREISALPFGSVKTRVPDQSTDVQMLLGRTATESRPLVPTADDGMVSRMVEIWSDLLGGSPIDADDDFFARGGHSLLAVRLLSRIENEWKVELPIGVLFDYSTPRLLSAQVESTRNPQRGIRRLGSTRAPLTFAQRRLWFLDQLSPGSANYHIPWRIGLEGELDLGALQVALDRLVVRHSVLRTRIVEIQGEPEQEVDPAYPVKIDFHDLSLVAPNSRDSQVSSLLTDQARLPFDLAHDQMMRVMLLKTGERKHILSVVTHHIASDAESMRILKKELKAAYDAEVREEAWIPDPLPFEYTDVAAWQQQRFSQQGEPGLAYWLETLSGDLPILDLRPDLPRPMTFTYSGGQAILTLENEVSETLLGTARRYSATPFMMLLAAFGVFLHRHTRQDDVIIGVAGTERVIPGTEGMIGFLVNTLPIRLRTGESHGSGRMATFVDYLVDTRQRVIEAMDHGQVPFEAIVEKVDPPRDPGRSPIYQVTFGLTDSSAGRFELAGLETMPAAVRQNERAVKFDLSLHCSVRSNGIRATFSYRTDLFRPATVRAFADQFGTLLKSIAESPDLPLDELNLVPNSEEELAGRDQVRQGPGRPPIGATPFSVFSAVASSRADAIAIEAADGTLTYKQLLADAVDLGSRLVALGVSSGEPVAILGHRSAAMVVAMLGVLAAGAAYVPIDPTYPDPRIQEMIEDAGITAVINCTADPANPEIVIKDADSTPYVGGDIAYLMYTSGSTGRAKAVKITQRGIVARFLSPTFIDVGPTDVMALVSSVSFDASTFEVFSALLNGASLVVVPPEVLLTPPKLAEFLHRRRVTIALFPTALFNAVIAEQPDAFASLHSLVVGGEAADAATMRRCLLNGPPRQLINAYGPTEATVLATYQVVTLSDTEQSTVPIGFPVSGTSVRIVDDRLHPVPAGMPGEILIGGEGLAAGYHGDPDLSDRTFVTIKGERFYRSGDLAMRRPAGDGGPGPIQFMGRLDRQLKIRGYRLEPAEIESRLLTHPQVLEAVVTPRHDHGEVRLTAYLVGSGDTNEIKAYLTERLPAFMVPASFVWLDAIPRTPQGKVDLSALPSPDLDRDDPVELADPDEQAMARIWESILHRSRVGRNDNFFDLGGHSLMAVKLFAAIEEAFGARPPLATVFEAPTVATLTKRLKQGFPTSTSSGELVEIRRGSGGPSLFLIHPAGGHVICYEGLARHLAPGQGVFGIQAVGVDGVKSPHRSIETMANHYVEVIKASQASGPYLIGGWSSGGLIAFEVARQLAAGGDEVGMLAMFDTNSPPSLRRSRRRRRWLNVAYIRRRVYMVARRYLGNVRHGLPWLYYRARARPVPTKRMTWHFNRLFRRMVTGYAPGFYDGTITYFRAKDGPGSLLYPTGWKTLSTAIEVIDTAGTHEGRTALVREPQAADLAEKLQHLINERYL
jgi:amino acid adenylation domain-containing protein